MLAFRDCAPQHRIKYGAIEVMQKEMCTDRPARANVEVDDTEYQRNDEKARCDEHGLPCLMSAQNKPKTNQRGKRGKIPRRAIENLARHVRRKGERQRNEPSQG